MMEESQPPGKGVYWTLRLWSVAVITILLLSTCFIMSCVVTYQFTVDKPSRRLSELHTYHSSLSCFSEGTMVSDKVWSCCPKNWKPFGSNCYFTSNDTESRDECKQKCSSMGAHLLVIHSKEEQDFITGILDHKAAYFIGLRDEGHRQWRWVDGTSYNKSAIFWHHGEPSSNQEKCVILNIRQGLWGWNDILCSNTGQRSICQLKRIYL